MRIAVRDDGPGVPAPLQPNVFERFTRGDGGRVGLDSHPGDTTFAVTLPG